MIQRWLHLISFAALAVCAVGCCHARNLSGWGHSPQTAVPVDASGPITFLPPSDASSPSNPPPCKTPPPCNPANLCSPDGSVQFTIADDDQPTTRLHFKDDMSDLWPAIKQDYRNYYSCENLEMLGAAFGVAAVIANSQCDRELREQYQQHVRGPTGDHFAVWCKDFGNGALMIPAMAAGWLGGDIMYDWPVGNALGEWGERSMRSMFVGAPPMLLMQYVTGGGRPGENNAGSRWKPFADNNGVSGHAFVGGVVFIDAAKMTENCWLKTSFYALSVLPAWSRINDDAHFPSQAFLGWWMAYCAATAVDTTQRNPSDWKVVPLPIDDGVGHGHYVSILDRLGRRPQRAARSI